MSRPRPVVLVEFSPSGGLFQFAVQLGDALAAAGHPVQLLTGPRPELAPSEPGFRIRPVLPTWHPIGDATPLPRWRRLVRRAGRAGRLVLAWGVLTGHLVRLRPRAVLWSYWRFSFEPLFVVLVAGLLRLPGAGLSGGGPVLGIVAHEPRPKSDAKDTSRPKDGPLLTRAFAAGWRRMDVVFTLGERTRQVVLDHWAPAGPVVVVPHGDERALLHGPVPPVAGTGPQALFFGSWTSYKGIDVLLEAFALVRARMPEARLVLAGDVSADLDLAAVLARAAEIGGVDPRPGYLPVAEVPAVLGAARVVVVPYVRASQSGVAHLAYTFGRPVVGTDVGDLPAVIRHGHTGLVVPPNDPAALAEALHGLLADPQRAADLGAAGRASVRAGWEIAARTIGRALDAAAALRRPGAPPPPDAVLPPIPAGTNGAASNGAASNGGASNGGASNAAGASSRKGRT